jgi:putative oxidoreductase
MKRIKIVYWVSTGVFSIVMLTLALGYLTSEHLKAAFSHLGFPEYFRIEMAVAKFIGIGGLLLPGVKRRAKEWIYAGFAFTLCSGFISHFALGDAAGSLILPLIMMAILIVSYQAFQKLGSRAEQKGLILVDVKQMKP